MSTNSKFDVTEQWVEDVAVGGAVLGGGGGGDRADGTEIGRVATEYGTPTVVDIDDLAPDDVVVTASAVGAPAAEDQYATPADYVRAFELLREELDARGESVAAILTNEMGGAASINGLVQSAVTGAPVVDAACNGRAHPTGPMGSMGLDPEETYLQAAVGGDPEAGRRVELTVEASLDRAASLVRTAAEEAGGLVAVARNPVTASYAADNAAVGVYEDARAIGRAVREHDGRDAVSAVADLLDGEVVATGEISEVSLRTEGGFDVGDVRVGDLDLTFWNEYMTASRDGTRLGTFPDLIATLSAETGYPLTTADVAEGQEVAVLVAPAARLSLGAGMDDRRLYDPVEEAVGESVIGYAFDA